jgi:hypothetical protein
VDVADFDQSLQSEEYVEHDCDRPSGRRRVEDWCNAAAAATTAVNPPTTTAENPPTTTAENPSTTTAENPSTTSARNPITTTTTARRPTTSVWLVAWTARTLRHVRVGPAYWDEGGGNGGRAAGGCGDVGSMLALLIGHHPASCCSRQPMGRGGGGEA